MKTVEDIRLERLKWVKTTRTYTTQQLADALGKSHSQISQLMTGAKHSKTGKPRTIGSGLAREFETKLGLQTGLFDTPVEQSITPTSVAEPVAQYVSYPPFTMPSKLVQWRALMKTNNERPNVPDIFETEVPDNALDPEVRAGWHVQCSVAESPTEGDQIIVHDEDGTPHLRLYRRVANGFAAVALRPGFRSFEPGQFTVFAVVMFTMRPRGA